MWKKGPQFSTEPAITGCEVDVMLLYGGGYLFHFVIEITGSTRGPLEDYDFTYLPSREVLFACWL